MEISPQRIRTIEFGSAKRGYDPDEVDAFRDQVAAALEEAQQQAATMEARARAAIAKLQEMAQQPAGASASPTPSQPASNEAEVLTRTLVLAQRTADAAIAEARAEADALVQAARDEATRAVDDARHAAAKVADEARVEARRTMEDERLRAENEVQALLARRDFLLGDVDQLEQYIQTQRERMREVAAVLHDLAERVPGGLGDMRRPLMSASATAHSIAEPTSQSPTSAPAEIDLPVVAAAAPAVDITPAATPLAESPLTEVLPSVIAEPAAGTVATNDRDDVWRILDDAGSGAVAPQQPAQKGALRPVAPSLPTLDEQFQGGLFGTDAITAEVPVIGDGFRIGGDDLR